MHNKCEQCGAAIPEGQTICHSCDRKATEFFKSTGKVFLGIVSVCLFIFSAGKIKAKLS